MAEITHMLDDGTGRMVQLVTPERLTEILLDDGNTLDRPAGFRAGDEWFVVEEETPR